MQRWTAVVFGLLFATAIVLVVVSVGGQRPSDAAEGPDAGLSSDGGLAPSSVVDPSLGGGPAAPFGDDGLGLELDELDEPPRIDAGGALLPSGEAPPPLSAEAPKSVVFGVVLISYLGAEGASKTARTRDEALRLAQEIAVEAREDFAGAVRRGDPGSLENAGALPRGVLEPAPEFVLFSLDKGAVSDPVDTPRGFWIVKRID